MNHLPLDDVVSAFQLAGVVRLFVKRLAENDNSKNQVYLGGNFELLNQLPLTDFQPKPSPKNRAIIHADMATYWLKDDGGLAPAPRSKVILYPQYPEVRWSGFLLGTKGAPNELMNSKARIANRILFMGVREDRTVVVRVHTPDSPVANELEASGFFEGAAALTQLPMEEPHTQLDRLLTELLRIARSKWVASVRLDLAGIMHPCKASNCGGLTLEAYLGIASNSRSEPDFEGWEIKQFAVSDFTNFRAKSAVTLFTPEPTGGIYASSGVETFIRKFGYPDTKGRVGRTNFGGRFKVGTRQPRTGLTLKLDGVNEAGDRILDSLGGVTLEDDSGEQAAFWPFASLIEHWNKKHAHAAYVPSLRREAPRQYRFADVVYLGEGTSFGLVLQGLSSGSVVYDPGIKMVEALGKKPVIKRRSQFRVSFNHLPSLYSEFKSVVIGGGQP